jgi:hypothetical protein
MFYEREIYGYTRCSRASSGILFPDGCFPVDQTAVQLVNQPDYDFDLDANTVSNTNSSPTRSVQLERVLW